MRWSSEKDRAFLRTLPPEAPALAEMPELWEECRLYMDAFLDLSPTRPAGMGGVGFIPLQEVAAWGALYRVADLETLWRHVHALDAAYVADYHEKAQRDHDQRQEQRQGTSQPGQP